jgi:hypothetical protein
MATRTTPEAKQNETKGDANPSNANPHSATIHKLEEPLAEIPAPGAPDQDPPANTTASTTKFSFVQHKTISMPYMKCSLFAKDGGMEDHNGYEEYGGAFVLLSFIVLWIWC